MSDTPRTDRAANESIVRVYETSKQLEIELSNALHIQRLLESELAAAKALAESNGKLAHERGIELMQSKEANAGLMKACQHLESEIEELKNQLNFLSDRFLTEQKQP
jgi:phage shock protein A